MAYRIKKLETTNNGRYRKVWKCYDKQSGKLEEIYAWFSWTENGKLYQRNLIISNQNYKVKPINGQFELVKNVLLLKVDTALCWKQLSGYDKRKLP